MKKYITGVLLLLASFSLAYGQTIGSDDIPNTNSCAIISSNLRYLSRDTNGSTEVSTLQEFLNVRGYLKSQPSGFFGSATRRAVIAFQNDNGLSGRALGYVGPSTRAKIRGIDCNANNINSVNTASTTKRTQSYYDYGGYCRISQIYTYHATPDEKKCTCPYATTEVSVGVPVAGNSQYECVPNVKPTEKVNLSSVMIDGANLKVTYDKNFDTCVHLLNQNGNKLHQQNLFCEQGTNKTATVPLSSISSANLVGQLVKLCHGNNYNVCSPLVGVTGVSVINNGETFIDFAKERLSEGRFDYTLRNIGHNFYFDQNKKLFVSKFIIELQAGSKDMEIQKSGWSDPHLPFRYAFSVSMLYSKGSGDGLSLSQDTARPVFDTANMQEFSDYYVLKAGKKTTVTIAPEYSVSGKSSSGEYSVGIGFVPMSTGSLSSFGDVARVTKVFENLPTGFDVKPTEKVNLSSVMLDGGYLKVTYDKNFDTCVHLVSQNGVKLHTNNLFCASSQASSAFNPLSSFLNGISVGQLVKLCHGNNYNLCSPLVAVTRERVINVLYPTTGMTFKQGEPIAVSWQEVGTNANYTLAYYNASGGGGKGVISTYSASQAHCNASDKCYISWTPSFSSQSITLSVVDNDSGVSGSSGTFTITSPVEKVNLSSVMIDGANLKVTYDKNFDTCVHLLNQNGVRLHTNNLFCASSPVGAVTNPLSSFLNGISVGQLVKLCHGNNYNVCSPLVAVTGGTVLISCLGGERLDGNVCVKDLGIGTITKGTCTIPAGKSSCLADVTFTTSYAISGRTKIATNDPSVGNELVIQYDGPYVAGESKKVSVPAYIQEQQLFLYINDAKAAQNTTKGTCEVGSTWYISTCQRNSIPKVPKGTDMSISPYSPAYVTATSSIFLSWGPIIYSEFPNISSYGTLSYIIRVDGVERNKGSTQSFAGTPASLGLARGAHVIDAKTCNETGCTAWSGAVTVYVDVSN